MKDYIKIEYAGGSNLYILATQLDQIQKYAGKDARKPKLNKLGSQEWTKTKGKVRGAVRQIAQDLVKLYAEREEQNGYMYDRIRYGRESLKNCSRLKRPKIRCLPLMQPSGIWRVIRL